MRNIPSPVLSFELTYDIYICIYIFTNLIPTSIHGTRKKEKKNLPGTRDKNISNHRPGEKEKILLVKKKEKANLVRPLEKKSRDTQSVGQKKTKTFGVGVRLPDDPISWNFSRRFPTNDLS